jgi:ribokinase
VADQTPLSVLTVGGAMIDTIVQIDADRIEQMRMTNAHASYLLVEAGRKVEAESIDQHIGGGAVNAAVSMARQGGRVAALVKLGRDLNADKILERLAGEGVSPEFVARTERLATGSAVMISSHDRNAAIFTARGSNTLLVEEDLVDAAFARDLVYVTGLSDASADRFPSILSRARAAGAFVACNPGIRQLSSRAQPFFANLKNIDLLSVNRVEAAQMVPGLVAQGHETTGPALPDATPEQELATLGLEAGGFHMGLAAFIVAIRANGPSTVLITDGGKGAFAGDANGIYHCGTVPVEVAGTAGAGDAYASTFAFQVAKGADTPTTMRAATLNAASVIGQVDTQGGLLDGATLAKRVDAIEIPIRYWDY